MIDFINTNFERHIITMEDPVEYYHPHKKSIVVQREIGVDVPSFSEALRRALRQDPDVMLVGEMRDLATISAAVTAAETGHLVFGTLHTNGAASTINRLTDAFPTNQQEQIRVQLAGNLLAVLSQALCPRVDTEGMVAAYEFMYVTPGIQNLIRENKSFRIDSDIQTGKRYGMQLLDDEFCSVISRPGGSSAPRRRSTRAATPENRIWSTNHAARRVRSGKVFGFPRSRAKRTKKRRRQRVGTPPPLPGAPGQGTRRQSFGAASPRAKPSRQAAIAANAAVSGCRAKKDV